MPHCSVFGCNFQSKGNRQSEVSIHSFPKDEKLRKQWEDACGRDELPKDPRLCSRHFSADAFEDFHRPQLMKELTGISGYKRRLKPNAVPTIFPHVKEPKRPRVATVSPVIKFFVKTSASVQCSPQLADASTQTDICIFDVPVQSKVTVHSPVTDHNYAYKHDTDLDVDNDDTSEEIFVFPDDSREHSQPQFSQSDPDFIESSSGFCQLTEAQTSFDSNSNPRAFLVFEDQLKQLLVRCAKCGSPVNKEDIKEMENEGSQLTLEITCLNNCSYRWQAQPTLSGTKGAGNLLLTASVFFSGIHFAKFERFCSNLNLKTISEDTYTSLREKHVFPIVKKTWINEQKAVLSEMKSKEKVVICGDSRCDSPGHLAKYCTYTFLDTQSSKVVDFKVMNVTPASNSNATELDGFKESLKNIQQNGVQVSTISTDRQPHIVNEMMVNNLERVLEFDLWHVAKAVSKKLTAEAKRKGCEDLGAWIPYIINYLWWSAQTCEENAVLLKEKWVSVINHVTDWPGNSHHHHTHEPLDEKSKRNKPLLKPGTEAHSALVKIVTDKQLLDDLDHLTKCVNTTALEVFHSMYLKYLPKKTRFGYDVMVHAAMLAALDHNNNVNRKQVFYQDGDSVCEPKYKISWSKVRKTCRPVAVGKDYSYMSAMMADVLSSAEDTRDMAPTINSPQIMGPQERVPSSHIISEIVFTF